MSWNHGYALDEYQGAIYSTKISGNFSLKLNGSVRSNRKSFEKSGPPFEVDLFSRLDRSDRNGPFHLTILIHFQSQDLAVRYLPCTKWRKILITEPLSEMPTSVDLKSGDFFPILNPHTGNPPPPLKRSTHPPPLPPHKMHSPAS